MSDTIEKTIKKIENNLKENETPFPPVPKGVATQHAIDARPSEMTPEMFEILTGERQDSDSEDGLAFDGSHFQLPQGRYDIRSRSLFESRQLLWDFPSEPICQSMLEMPELMRPDHDTTPHVESSIDETSVEMSVEIEGTWVGSCRNWVESAAGAESDKFLITCKPRNWREKLLSFCQRLKEQFRL